MKSRRMELSESSGAQRSRLVAALLGWTFDGFDGFLYVLVGFPVVEALVAKGGHFGTDAAAHQEAGVKATIIQAAFLVGWAIGGMVFGWIGDRLGRVRALRWTILVYAVFTALCAFADAWWQLLAFRFVAALGIGGEWAAGATLVAESLSPRHRAWASATLQSGYIVGCILAAVVVRLMAGFEPRFVFLFGLLPAVLALWVRRHVTESPVWQAKTPATPDPSGPHPPKERIWPAFVTTTCVSAIALTGAWAFLFFLGPTVRQIAAANGWDAARGERVLADVTITYFVVNLFGNFAASYLSRLIGYRATFAVFFLGTGITLLLGFGSPMTVMQLYIAASGFAFFGLGIFGVFPLYVPAVFPTRCRNLCSGTTYNLGRLVAAAGTLGAGWIAMQAGGPRESLWWLWTIYALGVMVSGVIVRPRYLTDASDTPDGI